MASVLLICACLMGSVYGQTVKKTSETNIFIDPTNPLSDAFHNVAATAEGSLVSQRNLADISQNLQGFSSAELPAALKQILAGAASPDAAVMRANQNSDKLLNTDGNKIQKAFQLFQNNAALRQVMELRREKDSAVQAAQAASAQQIQSELARILQQQQQQPLLLAQQQHQQQQLQLQQRLQQQQQQQQQGNSLFVDTPIPNADQSLIAANLLPSSNVASTGTTDPGLGSSGFRGSSISSSSTSQTSRVATKTSKKSEKKRKLEEKLNKLRERIAKKKKEKEEAAKAKKAAAVAAANKAEAMSRAATQEAAQRQAEELSRNNQFNAEATPSGRITGVSSQNVLVQAGENAAAEARIAGMLGNQGQVTSEAHAVPFGQNQRFIASRANSQFIHSSPVFNEQTAQGSEAHAVPFGQSQGFIASRANPQFIPSSPVFTEQTAQGMSFVPSFNDQNQIFQSGSPNVIGSFDINNAQSVSTRANSMPRSIGLTRSTPNMAIPSSRGFLARVNFEGNVVPLTNNVGSFQSPNNFVQFSSPSQFTYNSAFPSHVPYTSAVYNSPYQNYAPYTASYSTMAPIINSAAHSPLGGNVLYSSSGLNPAYSFSYPTVRPSLQAFF